MFACFHGFFRPFKCPHPLGEGRKPPLSYGLCWVLSALILWGRKDLKERGTFFYILTTPPEPWISAARMPLLSKEIFFSPQFLYYHRTNGHKQFVAPSNHPTQKLHSPPPLSFKTSKEREIVIFLWKSSLMKSKAFLVKKYNHSLDSVSHSHQQWIKFITFCTHLCQDLIFFCPEKCLIPTTSPINASLSLFLMYSF